MQSLHTVIFTHSDIDTQWCYHAAMLMQVLTRSVVDTEWCWYAALLTQSDVDTESYGHSSHKDGVDTYKNQHTVAALIHSHDTLTQSCDAVTQWWCIDTQWYLSLWRVIDSAGNKFRFYTRWRHSSHSTQPSNALQPYNHTEWGQPQCTHRVLH